MFLKQLLATLPSSKGVTCHLWDGTERSWFLEKLAVVGHLRKCQLCGRNDAKGMRPSKEQPPNKPPPDLWAQVLCTGAPRPSVLMALGISNVLLLTQKFRIARSDISCHRRLFPT